MECKNADNDGAATGKRCQIRAIDCCEGLYLDTRSVLINATVGTAKYRHYSGRKKMVDASHQNVPGIERSLSTIN